MNRHRIRDIIYAFLWPRIRFRGLHIWNCLMVLQLHGYFIFSSLEKGHKPLEDILRLTCRLERYK